MTNQRSDQVRYGQFSGPDHAIGTRKKSRAIPPITFQKQDQWWEQLSQEAKAKNGRVLVYVHGYRETFLSSTLDSVQIARLTGFEGPLIQYSWPSQGEALKYVADETNMYWDERNFRGFLQKLAQQEWVKDIILVSHSLGARLVIPAVEYVDRNSSNADSSNISNIILASPDVDRDDFERDIAEEVLAARRVNNDRRITIYLSAKDKALGLSRRLHGYPRLGSPRCFNPFEAAELKGRGLPERCYASKFKYDVAPVKSGLTIIDTSAVSRGGSGHSDFLRSKAACLDFAAVAAGQRAPTGARKPTHLAHVFMLVSPDKSKKSEDDAACKVLVH